MSTGWSWPRRTPVNRFYTTIHSSAKLWNTILEALGISCRLWANSLWLPKSWGEGGRGKQGPNFITCCAPLISAHYLKPLVHDPPVEDGWRILGVTIQSTGRQGRSNVETRGCGVCHSSHRGPKMNSFIISTMCMLPQKGESPFTVLGLTDSLLKASGVRLLCKSY